MNLGCHNCEDKKSCNISKRYCKHCGELSVEAVGQFSIQTIRNRIVMYSCYNEECDLFGRLVDTYGNPIHIDNTFLEKAVY